MSVTQAHTIFHVPPHVERVPAYVRRHLGATGPRVVIGCMNNGGPIVISAAIHTPPKRKQSTARRIAAGFAVFVFGAMGR